MVHLTELVLRDGHQSLLATRMRTEDMLPVSNVLDQVGFFSLEVWGGATFDVCLRYLNEDPWERLRQLKSNFPNTPLQMLERGMNIVGYRNFPDDIVIKFIKLAHRNGIDYFRIFDALNDLRNIKVPIETVNSIGAHAQGTICYAISPIHTVEYYVEQFKALADMGCSSLCIKDMAGIISPQRAYDIIYACKESGIHLPIVLHSHSTSGMAPLSYLKACEAGVDVLDCSISPLSGGTGHPATESIVAAFQDTPYDTGYDLRTLENCKIHFKKVWDKYSSLHRDQAMKTDPSVVVHQIPGGMLSNFIIQLEQFGAVDRYHEVLLEATKVQKDLGWPPLVTPLSQIVGVQSTLNVVYGRYKQVTSETKEYIRGMYGKPPGVISPEIYSTILGKNWKDQVIDVRPADLLDPLYNETRDLFSDRDLPISEENIVSYCMFPTQTESFLNGTSKPEPIVTQIKVNMDDLTRNLKATINEQTYDVIVKKLKRD